MTSKSSDLVRFGCDVVVEESGASGIATDSRAVALGAAPGPLGFFAMVRINSVRELSNNHEWTMLENWHRRRQIPLYLRLSYTLIQDNVAEWDARKHTDLVREPILFKPCYEEIDKVLNFLTSLASPMWASSSVSTGDARP